MNFLARHITVYFLAVIILLANTGVSMHWLYCVCKGQMQKSLFDLQSGCVAKTRVDCCPKKEENPKPCCQKFKTLTDKLNAHNCTQKGTIFFKADLKFTQATFDSKSAEFLFDTLTVQTQLFDYQKFITEENFIFHVSNKKPPPLLANRELLVRIQSFLC